MNLDYFYDNILSEKFLLLALISIIIFLIIREFNCWYWKQNEIVNLLKEIRENNRKDDEDGEEEKEEEEEKKEIKTEKEANESPKVREPSEIEKRISGAVKELFKK
jgi:hypothetical protein